MESATPKPVEESEDSELRLLLNGHSAAPKPDNRPTPIINLPPGFSEERFERAFYYEHKIRPELTIDKFIPYSKDDLGTISVSRESYKADIKRY